MVLSEYDSEAVLPKKKDLEEVLRRENFNGRVISSFSIGRGNKRVDTVTCSEGIGWGRGGLCGHMINLRSGGLWLWWRRVSCDRFEYELSCRDRGYKRNKWGDWVWKEREWDPKREWLICQVAKKVKEKKESGDGFLNHFILLFPPSKLRNGEFFPIKMLMFF